MLRRSVGNGSGPGQDGLSNIVKIDQSFDTEDGSAKRTLLAAAGLQNRNIVECLACIDDR